MIPLVFIHSPSIFYTTCNVSCSDGLFRPPILQAGDRGVYKTRGIVGTGAVHPLRGNILLYPPTHNKKGKNWYPMFFATELEIKAIGTLSWSSN